MAYRIKRQKVEEQVSKADLNENAMFYFGKPYHKLTTFQKVNIQAKMKL